MSSHSEKFQKKLEQYIQWQKISWCNWNTSKITMWNKKVNLEHKIGLTMQRPPACTHYWYYCTCSTQRFNMEIIYNVNYRLQNTKILHIFILSLQTSPTLLQKLSDWRLGYMVDPNDLRELQLGVRKGKLEIRDCSLSTLKSLTPRYKHEKRGCILYSNQNWTTDYTDMSPPLTVLLSQTYTYHTCIQCRQWWKCVTDQLFSKYI